MGKRIVQIALSSAAIAAAGTAAFGACMPDTLWLRGDWGTARFTVEIADDAEERAQGLMHRSSMPRAAGMLFVYPYPRAVAFWMRNTLIPLDMVFADSEGVVRHIHSNAVPLDETPIPGGDDIQYVLEINGGLSSSMGITVGSQIQHLSIGQTDAAWPCDN